MNTERRTKLQIYFDVLRLVSDESKLNGDISPTRVAHKANIPYDRFRKCLQHLDKVGMICQDDHGRLAVTGKGLEYLEEYVKIEGFLKRMGLWSS